MGTVLFEGTQQGGFIPRRPPLHSLNPRWVRSPSTVIGQTPSFTPIYRSFRCSFHRTQFISTFCALRIVLDLTAAHQCGVLAEA